MTLNEYYRAFTEDELIKGAELYFSGDMADIQVTENPGGAALLKSSGKASIYRYAEKKGTTYITGKWREMRNGQEASFKCSLFVQDEIGVPCATSCCCDEFQDSFYGCQHIAALFTEYYLQKNGDDALRGTQIETSLKNMTGVEDPFLPGVLKRTDNRLLSILKGNEDRPLPVWQEETVVQNDVLRTECFLDEFDGILMLRLAVGSGRTYQIRDLPGLLKAWRNGERYTIGKKEYLISRASCDAFTGQLLEFLSGMQTAAEKGMYSAPLFYTGGGRDGKYIVLLGHEFDNFMKLCDGRTLVLNGETQLPVTLDRKGLHAVMRKKAYGASIQIEPASYLYTGSTGIYLYDKEGIFHVVVSSTEETHELLSLLEWSEPMYVRESDIGSVCRNIIPVFQNFGTVVTRGMDLDNYEKETPEFVFNLDYPSEQKLTCIPYAEYPKQEFKCLLYDSETNAARRNPEAESRAADILPGLFEHLDRRSYSLYSNIDEDGLYDFMLNQLPRLEELGSVMVTDSLRKNRVRRLPNVTVGVSVKSSGLLLSMQGTDLSAFEMADILSSYTRKKKYYRLKSGEFLTFEGQEDDTWDTLADLYHNYGSKDPENIKLPLYRALYLQEMLEKKETAVFNGTDEYRGLIASMKDFDAQSFMVPDTLDATMRPYQKEGYRWISMLKRCGFGGILADDMGLGKTLQVLSFLLAEKMSGKVGDELRTLVICPASLVYNWKKEIENYTGSLSVMMVTGTASARKEMIESQSDADIWITSYDLLKRDIAFYENVHFANEVIDEAQFIKNQNTQAAKSVRIVDSAFRMALTGTPIENHLSELWSIMDYLMPGFLYSYTRFQKDYETPIVVHDDAYALERLRKMVHPFILRRLKKQVLKELPDKLEEVITVRMEGEQKRLYDASVERIRLELDKTTPEEFKSGKLEFLAELTKLRQICCDPSLLYENFKGESAKLEACLELISQAIEGGHKLLLFSQFTTMLDIICEKLSSNGIEYHRIDGSVSKERRMQMVDSFANDDVPVFCISLKAGGTGLNLTAADIVIHYDPWWNQAAQDQATDRTHRIGQTQTVTVYELIASGSIEERIQKIKEGKSKLVEDVLSGGEISSSVLNKEDMLALLE